MPMKKSRSSRIVVIVVLFICTSYAHAGITFKSSIPMWDTWMIQVEDEYHLFYLRALYAL